MQIDFSSKLFLEFSCFSLDGCSISYLLLIDAEYLFCLFEINGLLITFDGSEKFPRLTFNCL